MGQEDHTPMHPMLVLTETAVSHYYTLLKHLLAEFAQRSISSVLICPSGGEIESLLCGSEDIFLYPPLPLPFMEYLCLKNFTQQLSRCKADVIHCLSEKKSVMVRYLAHLLDIPYILHLNASTRISSFSVSERHCARLLVPTRRMLEEMQTRRTPYIDRITCIPMGCEITDICHCFHHPHQLPGMIIKYPMEAFEDFEMILNAIKNLVIEGYEFTVLMMGQGRAERLIRQYIGTLGLLKIVTIVPELKPWRSVLASADICIQPRPTHAFNPWLLEAMGMGVVVATSRGGAEDMVHDGETAMVFDPDDELSIRTVLQRLLDRREWARQLARQAQDYLRAHHRIDQMIEGVLHAYEVAGRDY
jgi:hypothetical protein